MCPASFRENGNMSNALTIIAEDEKIALRPLTLEDSALVVKWRNNPRVRKNYIYQKEFTLEGQERYFREVIATGRAYQFVILEKPSLRPVGCTVLADPDREQGTAEYGNFIGEDDALGNAYSSHAMQLTSQYASRELGLYRLLGRIFVDNTESIRSSERGGMHPVRLLPDVERTDGTRKDMLLMEIVAKDHGGARLPLVSFCIPCYHSEKTLPGVVAEIDDAMAQLGEYRWEVIMVNDGSGSATWETIRTLCRGRSDRHGMTFARNFGQHAALMAAIRKAEGDILVCLDDDGQTPASEVGLLLHALENGENQSGGKGADVVYADYGHHKQHSFFRNLGSAVNEKMCQVLLEKPKDLYVSSYFAMRRFVADEVIRYENSYPYVLGLVLRATKNIVNVPVHHRKRESGASGYSFGKLIALWLNGFTSFSIKPLRIATTMGAFFAGIGFLYGIYTIIKKLVRPDVPMGFSALMTAVIFFGGMLMLMVGLAGEYIGRTYISVNKAPQYVIRETTDGQHAARETSIAKDGVPETSQAGGMPGDGSKSEAGGTRR